MLECVENQHQAATNEGTWDVPLLDQLQLGNTYVQVLNCYLQPGEQQNLKERAMKSRGHRQGHHRQDPSTPIVVCGDFNNHMTYIVEQLGPLNFNLRWTKN
jgi:hypothetical protein